VSLGSSQSVDKIAQLLKGEAAFWFNNKSGIMAPKLQWQEDYFCVSISESGSDSVRAYIDNQEVHHQNKTFAQEYEEFMTKYRFQLMQ
jgi:REP element-mobilizing transposase RayT